MKILMRKKENAKSNYSENGFGGKSDFMIGSLWCRPCGKSDEMLHYFLLIYTRKKSVDE